MDSDEDKIYKLIGKNPRIHQKVIIDKTYISKNTVRKILDKLRTEKRIFGQKNGRRTEFTVSGYYPDPEKLIGNIEKTADSLNGFVHSVTEKHEKYQFETIQHLYREISEMYKRLLYDVKDYDAWLRENSNIEDYKKVYREDRLEIIKTVEEIVLESSLKNRIGQYQMNAGDIFDRIVSLLHEEKRKSRSMGGKDRRIYQTRDKIKQYDMKLDVLAARQSRITTILNEIKTNEGKEEAGYADDESTELARSIKMDRNKLNDWQEKIMAYEEKLNELRQDASSDHSREQNADSIAKTAKERISDMRGNFDDLATALERLEIGVITD